MDYKEKYEKALCKAKKYHQQLLDEDNPEWASEIEEIFPGLKEIEDEKIRKELIRAFTVTADKRDCEIYGNGITYGQVLAWLEKQVEQKPTDAEMKELLRTEYEKGRADVIAETQVAWGEEDEKMLNLIIAIFEVNHQYGYFKANELNDSNMKTVYTEEIVDWLKSLEIRITNKQ